VDGARPPATTLFGDWRFQVGVVISLALMSRVPYLFQIREWPFFYYPVLDSRTQYKWATILVETWGLGNPEVTAKAPFYSYFLAFSHWLFGEKSLGVFSARAIQLALGAVTCGMTYLLGRRVFGQTAGFLAGIMAALYSPWVFRDGQLLDTALATFLATAFLLALLAAHDSPSTGRWLGTGLLLGLLGITRPNLLLLGPVTAGALLLWAWRKQETRLAGRAIGILALGAVLPILPITGRNYLITGGFLPISATGGINLHTGNNPDSDGYSPIPSGIAWERTWYQAEAAAGAYGSRAQDAHWRSLAFKFWREQPLRALTLLVKKVYLYWNAYEIPNNMSYEWARERSSVLRLVPLTFAVVGPLGLLGIALGGWRSRQAWLLVLFVATNMIAVAIFFICGRYRMPAVPALCAFAGFALVTLARLCSAKRWAGLLLGLTALAVFAVFVNSDAYGVRRVRGANRDGYYLGQSYVLGGDYHSAKEAFRLATRADPRDADAYALLGWTEMLTGEPEAAAEDIKQSLEIAPDFSTSAMRLAQLHLDQGWPLDEPERLLRRAVDLQPRHVSGLAALVRVHVRQGKLSEAEEELARAHEVLAAWGRADTRRRQAEHDLARASAEALAAGVTRRPTPTQ